MKLIGGNHSPFVRRIALVLEALGLAYEQAVLRTAEHRQEILRYNPVGRVPNLVLDDGRIIIDSHAILDYLERHVAGSSSIFPQAEAERMRMLYADALGIAALEKLILWFYETTRRDPALRCEATVAGYEEQMDAALRSLADLLAQQPYLCGDKLTLADITAASLVDTLALVAPDLVKTPDFDRLHGLAARVRDRLPLAETP